MTGDTNTRKIHIDYLNHFQDEVEEKYQQYQINIFLVVHDMEFFFNGKTIDRNIMYLPDIFEA